MMAFAADQTARYDKALETYEGVLAMDGNDSTALFGKGDALYKLGRFEESLTALDSALKADPKRPLQPTRRRLLWIRRSPGHGIKKARH